MNKKQVLLTNALKRALRDCLLNQNSVTNVEGIDITECRAYDKDDNLIDDISVLEKCKSGSFTASMRIEEADKDGDKVADNRFVTGQFQNVEYDIDAETFTLVVTNVSTYKN